MQLLQLKSRGQMTIEVHGYIAGRTLNFINAIRKVQILSLAFGCQAT